VNPQKMYTLTSPKATPLPPGLQTIEAPCNVLETPGRCGWLVEGRNAPCDAMVTTYANFRHGAHYNQRLACDFYMVDPLARQNSLAYIVGSSWPCGAQLMNYGLGVMRESGELQSIMEAALPSAAVSCKHFENAPTGQTRRLLAEAGDHGRSVHVSERARSRGQAVGRQLRGAGAIGAAGGGGNSGSSDDSTGSIQIRHLIYALMPFGVIVGITFLFAVIKRVPNYFPWWLVPPLGVRHRFYETFHALKQSIKPDRKHAEHLDKFMAEMSGVKHKAGTCATAESSGRATLRPVAAALQHVPSEEHNRMLQQLLSNSEQLLQSIDELKCERDLNRKVQSYTRDIAVETQSKNGEGESQSQGAFAHIESRGALPEERRTSGSNPRVRVAQVRASAALTSSSTQEQPEHVQVPPETFRRQHELTI
jgi:hypothetical protein